MSRIFFNFLLYPLKNRKFDRNSWLIHRSCSSNAIVRNLRLFLWFECKYSWYLTISTYKFAEKSSHFPSNFRFIPKDECRVCYLAKLVAQFTWSSESFEWNKGFEGLDICRNKIEVFGRARRPVNGSVINHLITNISPRLPVPGMRTVSFYFSSDSHLL